MSNGNSTPPVNVGPAPVRQPMFDARGGLTKPWLIWFEQLFTAGATLTQLDENVTDSTLASAFDERTPIDYSRAIEDALLAAQPAAPRDYAPALEETLTLLREASPRVYDDSELRAGLAAGDPARGYDDADLRAVLAALDYGPHLGLQQQIDELRVLVASADTPEYSNFYGLAGYLLAANNLSDVANAPSALANLGGASLYDLAAVPVENRLGVQQQLEEINTRLASLDIGFQLLGVEQQMDELNARLLSLDIHNWQNVQQQLDELRVLAASGDVQQLSNFFSGLYLLAANNLSDVASESTALANLGGASLTLSNTFSGSQEIIEGNVSIANGTTAPRQQLSVGAYLDLYASTSISATGPSVRADSSGNACLSGYGTGAVYLAFDKGSGGVNFGNGATSVVAGVSSAGAASFAGLTVNNAASITLGSNWVSWTPTVTCSGSMTISGLSVTAQYLRFGPMVFFWFSINGTLGGTSSLSVYVTLPVNAIVATSTTAVIATSTTSWSAGFCSAGYPSASQMNVQLAAGASYPLGAVGIQASGFYRCT